MVPMVPGAHGDNPEPKPNASKCLGSSNSFAGIGLAAKVLIPFITFQVDRFQTVS